MKLSFFNRFLFSFFVIFFTSFSYANNGDVVGIEFKDIKISSLVDSIVRGILDRDYVISPTVLKSDSTVTLSLKSVERGKVLDVLRSSLSGVGATLIERSGIFFVEPFSNFSESKLSAAVSGSAGFVGLSENITSMTEPVVYFPRYRPPELLTLVIRAAGGVVSGREEKESEAKRDFLVYTSSPENLEKISKLLSEVDRPLLSVQVRAALLEVTDSAESARSIGAVFDLFKGRLGIDFQSGTRLPNSLSIKGASIDAILSAIDGDSRFRYLSEPSIRVLDGESAKLVVGSDVPVRGQTVISNGQAIQGIDYKTAGVVITIAPRILSKSIVLKITQQVSSFIPTSTSGIDSPTMQKREAQTVVDAKEGDLIVIAGMDELKEFNSGSGVSWLPEVLRRSSETKGRTQVLLMLEVTRHHKIES